MRFHRPRPLTGRPTRQRRRPLLQLRPLPRRRGAPRARPGRRRRRGDRRRRRLAGRQRRRRRGLAGRRPAGRGVLAHAVNAGHIRPTTTAWPRSRGDYVVLLSADDLLPPRRADPRGRTDGGAPAGRLGLRLPRVLHRRAAPRATADAATGPSGAATNGWVAVPPQGQVLHRHPEVVMRREALATQIGAYDAAAAALGRPRPVAAAPPLRWDIGRVNGPDQALYRVHGANMHLTTYAGWLITDLRERAHDVRACCSTSTRPGRPDADGLRPLARARAGPGRRCSCAIGDGVETVPEASDRRASRVRRGDRSGPVAAAPGRRYVDSPADRARRRRAR